MHKAGRGGILPPPPPACSNPTRRLSKRGFLSRDKDPELENRPQISGPKPSWCLRLRSTDQCPHQWSHFSTHRRSWGVTLWSQGRGEGTQQRRGACRRQSPQPHCSSPFAAHGGLRVSPQPHTEAFAWGVWVNPVCGHAMHLPRHDPGGTVLVRGDHSPMLGGRACTGGLFHRQTEDAITATPCKDPLLGHQHFVGARPQPCVGECRCWGLEGRLRCCRESAKA